MYIFTSISISIKLKCKKDVIQGTLSIGNQNKKRPKITRLNNHSLDENESRLMMLWYIEIIDMSFRYPYMESYRIGQLNIDFCELQT